MHTCLNVSKIASLFLILFLVPSCATMVSRRKAVESLAASTPCCASVDEFRYEQLPPEEPVTFRLDETSDSFAFPSGKSYFKAFLLPEKAIPYRIHVESFALGEKTDSAHIFYPRLALLDDGFIVRKQSKPGDFVLKKAGFRETASATRGLQLKLEGSILVDMPDVRYLLVHTTDELLATTSQYTVLRIMPIIFPGLVGAIPLYKEPVDIPHSPFGWIYIKAGDDVPPEDRRGQP